MLREPVYHDFEQLARIFTWLICEIFQLTYGLDLAESVNRFGLLSPSANWGTDLSASQLPSESKVRAKSSDRWRPRRSISLGLLAKKWFPILAQAATLLISLAALYVITRQASIYDKQRRLMDETKAVLSEQTELIRVAQRAYVGVGDVTKPDFEDRRIFITVENAGHVPARNVSVQVWVASVNGAGSITKRFEELLFPGDLKMQVPVTLNELTPSDIKEIKSKKRTLFVIGTIEYNDGFGTQSTHFGFEYKPPPNERWVVRSDLVLK